MSTRHYLLSAALGAALSYGVLEFAADDSSQLDQIATLENRILDLEQLLAQKEEDLADARFFSAGAFAMDNNNAPAGSTTKSASASAGQNDLPHAGGDEAAAVVDIQQRVKDLGTISDRDPRSFSEKANALLAADSSRESVAIVSRGLVDMAENREILPDHELESLYQQQQNPDLKRVLAQVMSTRGDNRLLEKQIQDSQARLRSEKPEERQKALVELAKTRYASAATVIAPLLQDENNSVKLDALLALRATGNQSHTRLVEALVNDPDPSVSWLAKDVIANLQNLSEKARTQIASTDIVAELPAMDAL